RLPADGRVHRQVVHLLGRRPGRALLAGGHRRSVDRLLGLLLPAHRGDDVHDRRRVRPRAPAHLGAGDGRARLRHAGDVLPRRAAHASPGLRRGIREGDLLAFGAWSGTLVFATCGKQEIKRVGDKEFFGLWFCGALADYQSVTGSARNPSYSPRLLISCFAPDAAGLHTIGFTRDRTLRTDPPCAYPD